MSLAALALIGALIPSGQDAKLGAVAPYRVEYEDQDVRVLRLVVAPKQRAEMRQHPDRVAVIITRGGQEQIDALVEWQPAGAAVESNSADGRFEAIFVEFKGPEITGPLPTPSVFTGAAQVQVISNARAEVRHVVVGPGAVAPNPGCHIHDKPTVYIHLSSGDVSGVAGGSKAVSVSRGQVTVLVPGQQHFFFQSNKGLADFLEIRSQGARAEPQTDCQ